MSQNGNLSQLNRGEHKKVIVMTLPVATGSGPTNSTKMRVGCPGQLQSPS